MRHAHWIYGMFAAAFCIMQVALPSNAGEADARARRSRVLQSSLGVFSGEPRGKDDRTNIPVWYLDWKAGKVRKPQPVNVEKLVAELVDIKADTFHWMIWFAPTDWEDLQRFLPLAAEKGISVWVSVMPPKQQMPKGFSTPIYSEPYRLDYEKWAEEIAKLSLREPNLVAWSIDDFPWDLETFTPDRMKRIVYIARRISPRLAFVPCVYYQPLVKPGFAENYGDLLDGVLFPYRCDSDKSNLTDASFVDTEVKHIRKVLGPSIPIIVDVYATDHTGLGSSTPEYVRQVMIAARDCADGVHVYCHQSPTANPEKYEIVKKLFQRWSAEDDASNRESGENDPLGHHRPGRDAKKPKYAEN